jgi:hypothetical protein
MTAFDPLHPPRQEDHFFELFGHPAVDVPDAEDAPQEAAP